MPESTSKKTSRKKKPKFKQGRVLECLTGEAEVRRPGKVYPFPADQRTFSDGTVGTEFDRLVASGAIEAV